MMEFFFFFIKVIEIAREILKWKTIDDLLINQIQMRHTSFAKLIGGFINIFKMMLKL